LILHHIVAKLTLRGSRGGYQRKDVKVWGGYGLDPMADDKRRGVKKENAIRLVRDPRLIYYYDRALGNYKKNGNKDEPPGRA